MKLYFLIGGSWYDSTSFLRASIRFGYDPDLRYSIIGFRLVRSKP